MRIFLKASFPVEAGNRAIKDGSIGKTIQSILDECKPEAAYFTDHAGQRTAFLFLDIQDASQIPAVAEPWFLAFNASIEIHPAMNAADLAKAGPRIEQAVKKYGHLATAADVAVHAQPPLTFRAAELQGKVETFLPPLQSRAAEVRCLCAQVSLPGSPARAVDKARSGVLSIEP